MGERLTALETEVKNLGGQMQRLLDDFGILSKNVNDKFDRFLFWVLASMAAILVAVIVKR